MRRIRLRVSPETAGRRTVKELGRPRESAMMDSPNGEGEPVRTSAGIRNRCNCERGECMEAVRNYHFHTLVNERVSSFPS
jgi:hypothetical protein